MDGVLRRRRFKSDDGHQSLARVAVKQTERAWLELHGKAVRQLESRAPSSQRAPTWALDGSVPKPARIDLQTKLERALPNLGCRESAVHRALTHVGRDDALATAPIEQWLRAALQRLTPAPTR